MAENNQNLKAQEDNKNPKRLTKEQITEKAKREVFLRLLMIHKQKQKP